MKEASDMLGVMIDAGGRFVNLEQRAGEGVSIILGQGSESSWIKLLPKSGPRFEGMIQRLYDIQLHEKHPRECRLRVRVVDWLLNELDGGSNSLETPRSTRATFDSDMGLTVADENFLFSELSDDWSGDD